MSERALWLAVDDRGEPEIFHAIQGEGISQGAPRVFIRLSGCNLHCVWCDTPYTWNWTESQFAHEDGKKFDISEERVKVGLADIANKVSAFQPVGIVITGGEPLLQQRQLPAMIDAIKEQTGPIYVEIETNGSIAPDAQIVERVNQFNVSPKLHHSGNEPSLALNPDRLSFWRGCPGANFKFVVSSPKDLDEIDTLIRSHRIPASRVSLMPLGRDGVSLRARSEWLTEECLKRGYRFTDRLHIHLFGDTRGT